MRLPFSTEQFFAVFADYNRAVWPLQALLLVAAIAAVVLALCRRRAADTWVSGIIATLWVWMGFAYHLAFFARINPLAYVFAALSLAAAMVFFRQGVWQRRLRFAWRGGLVGVVGAALIAFALVLYPAWSWLAGHAYPFMPTFGLPCPTTIFTIGMMAFAAPPYPRTPLVVPVLWCAVGAQAAFFLAVPQDLALIFAGLVGIGLLRGAGASPSP